MLAVKVATVCLEGKASELCPLHFSVPWLFLQWGLGLSPPLPACLPSGHPDIRTSYSVSGMQRPRPQLSGAATGCRCCSTNEARGAVAEWAWRLGRGLA